MHYSHFSRIYKKRVHSPVYMNLSECIEKSTYIYIYIYTYVLWEGWEERLFERAARSVRLAEDRAERSESVRARAI